MQRDIFNFIDYRNTKSGNIALFKLLKLNEIHPSKWFIPFDRERIFDWMPDAYHKKRLIRNRCGVCYKTIWNDKIIKKRNNKLRCCENCLKIDHLYHYCSRKCQKIDWIKGHRAICGIPQ